MSTLGSTARRRMAGLAGAVFVVAFAALLAAQLSLMSVLDVARGEQVASEVARSELVRTLVDDAVRDAVTSIVGPVQAAEIAEIARGDPRVHAIIEQSLTSAHRQVVDPSASGDAGSGVGGADVDVVVAEVLDDVGQQVGMDLTGLAPQLAVPEVRPERTPDVGLRPLALTTRLVAGTLALAAGMVSVAIHPRPLRGLGGLGGRVGIVCAGWVVALLVIGWTIGRIDETPFGELLDALWSSAAAAMMGLVMAGLLLGGGVWLGARALDGLALRATRRAVR